MSRAEFEKILSSRQIRSDVPADVKTALGDVWADARQRMEENEQGSRSRPEVGMPRAETPETAMESSPSLSSASRSSEARALSSDVKLALGDALADVKTALARDQQAAAASMPNWALRMFGPEMFGSEAVTVRSRTFAR